MKIPLLFMLVEIILAREQLMADVTVELFFARMRNHVSHQMLLTAECLVTIRFIAFERAQAQMQLQMLGQVLLALEHLLAFRARRHVGFIGACWRCVDGDERLNGCRGWHCRGHLIDFLHFNDGRFGDWWCFCDGRLCGCKRSRYWLTLWRRIRFRYRRCGYSRSI